MPTKACGPSTIRPPSWFRKDTTFGITQQWLDHVRLSSIRLNDGGSGSFVSPNGPALTNHHVALGQLQKNSTPEHDYVKDGFYARTREEEMKSSDLEVNVLVSMENVTARVQDALKGARTPEQEFAKRKDAIAAIERESLQKTGFRSDVVPLYQGGEYWLYRYKKYTDVRLVFAPEQQIAFYGGDPDNFTYPRYDLDMALFRVYENDRPIQSTNYLKWNAKGAADGDLVFVSGHPGSTSRLDTLAQLETERDFTEPALLKILHRRIDALKKYSTQSPEAARQATTRIFSLENSLKAYDGRLKGLQDKRVMDAKRADEAKFKAQVMGNPQWKAAYGGAGIKIACCREESPVALQGTVFPWPGFDPRGFVQDHRAVRRRDQEAGWRAFEGLSRSSARIAQAADVFPRSDLSRDGNRSHDRGIGAGYRRSGIQRPWVKLVMGGKSPARSPQSW
jgi:hypothetical protein